jgi:hypothetical protein
MLKPIQLLARNAVRLLPQYYRPDCCIAATAIAIDVLRDFHVRAIPFPVKVMVFNKAFADIIQKQGLLFVDDAQKIDPAAYSVGIGYTEGTTKGYNGHLVALAGNVLIDLTLPQTNRPQHDIRVTPFVAPVADEFLHGDKPFIVENQIGNLLVYTKSSNTDYLTSNDWKLKGRRQHIVQEIIRRIRNH